MRASLDANSCFSKVSISPFLKKFFTTTFTSALSTIAAIVIIRLLAKGLGPEEFGAYSLARRLISTVAPIGLVSMNVALSRYIAMTEDIRTRTAYLSSGLILIIAALAVIVLAAMTLDQRLAVYFFKSSNYLGLYRSSLVMLIGYCLLVVTYSSFLGMQRVYAANLVHLVLITMIPFAIAFLLSKTVDASGIIFLMGLGYYLALIPLGSQFFKVKHPDVRHLKEAIGTLFKYGAPRIPAGFGLAGLFAFGPLLASIFGRLQDAGFFTVGQSAFRITETAVVAFGLVALPRVAQLHAEGNQGMLKSTAENLMVMIFHLGIFATIQTMIWSKEVILVWLGAEYQTAVPILQIIILALTPYIGYVMLRSVVDGIEVRPVNTVNIFISLGVALGFSLILHLAGLGLIGLAIGNALGFVFLGILTAVYLIRRFDIRIDRFRISSIILLNVIAGLCVLIGKHLLSFLSMEAMLSIGIILECLFFTGYVVILFRWQVPWTMELKKRIVWVDRTQ